MAMKKIKPQYGQVVAPVAESQENTDNEISSAGKEKSRALGTVPSDQLELPKREDKINDEIGSVGGKNDATVFGVTSDPNPFLQTKEIFGKARLTKTGYRMRTDYVEILDIIKKVKKNGYTLEAVIDDALTFYFENSVDGQEAIRKAAIFYS